MEKNEDPKLRLPCVVKIQRGIHQTPAKQLALSAELRKVIDERNMLTSNTRQKILDDLQIFSSPDVTYHKRHDDKLRALEEILQSELAYIKQIELMQLFFMKPIKEKEMINNNEFEVIFGNIDAIYRVNGALLEELKKDIMHLSSAFNKMAPFLKIYSEYAFNFQDAMDMINQLRKTHLAFRTFIKAQETRPEVQMKLQSLAIAPVQRIPRYCMLIKQVLRYTLEQDEDYITLKETYNKLLDVGKHINDILEERENSHRLVLLISKVKSGKYLIIKPGRKIIQEGIVKSYVANKKPSDVYMILFNDIIMFCAIKKDLKEQNCLKCNSIFPFKSCTINQKANLRVLIKCEDAKMEISSEDNTDEWYINLRKAMAEYHRNQSTLRRESSARKPAVKFNVNDYEDYGVSPGISRRRRRLFNDGLDSDVDEVKKNLSGPPKLKKRKLVQCKKSLKSLIPKFVRPKSVLSGIQSTTARNQGGSDDKGNEHVQPLPKVVSVSPKKVTQVNDRVLKDVDVHNPYNIQMDMLYPLRQHVSFQVPSPKVQVSVPPTNNDLAEYNPSVFVFGKKHNNSDGFTFGGIFTGVANSFKRALGFR